MIKLNKYFIYWLKSLVAVPSSAPMLTIGGVSLTLAHLMFYFVLHSFTCLSAVCNAILFGYVLTPIKIIPSYFGWMNYIYVVQASLSLICIRLFLINAEHRSFLLTSDTSSKSVTENKNILTVLRNRNGAITYILSTLIDLFNVCGFVHIRHFPPSSSTL